MTPARVTKSRTARVKSVADNNDCFQRVTIFFAQIARAVQMDAIFFRTDSPSPANGCPIRSHG